MIERHPFGVFVPPNAKFLLLGSFTTKQIEGYDWFYSNKRNQFWPILEEVYKIKLSTKEEKRKFLTKLRMAMADIILSCERKGNSNLDVNLINITYNTNAVERINHENNIETIYFTSRFVEEKFKKVFKEITQLYPKIKLITLPSPSPRYAVMSKSEKAVKYRKLLPGL